MTNTYEFAYTKMPFGKYRGYYLKDIPDDYVKWAIMNYTDQGVATMFAVELARRYPEYRKPTIDSELDKKIARVKELGSYSNRPMKRVKDLLG
jgi:hypothetical protein